MLDHEKLDVYQRALDLLDELDRIQSVFPKGRAHLRDQLERASSSVVLNIAEGAGEYSLADKQRFYRMARRSVHECAAILDILERRAMIGVEALRPARALMTSVVAMLTALAKIGQGQGQGRGHGS